MRVLETCTSAWPMAEVQQQVLTLRQAFSADITKPFELKATFPLGSPDMAAPRPSPPDRVDDVGTGAMVSAAASFPSTVARLHAQQQSVSLGPPNATPVDFHAHPITPPISTSGRDSSTSDSSPAQASLMMMSGGQRAAAAAAAQQQQQQQHVSQQQAVGGMMQPPILWNPTKIFEYVVCCVFSEGARSLMLCAATTILSSVRPPLFPASRHASPPLPLPLIQLLILLPLPRNRP